MSQLFDALHKSESERRAKGEGVVAPGPELLEIAERQFQERQVRGVVTEEREQSVSEPPSSFEFTSITAGPSEKLVCVTDTKGLAAEKFRFLSLRLTHLQQRKQIKALLITSSMAEEGKSMIAANLACALAGRHQQKVLLIEGDLRRPKVAGILGVGETEGIGEYFHHRQDSKVCIYQMEALALYFLAAGNAPKDPVAVMQSERLTHLMNQLRSYFDWIVIDSPPILPLGDTTAWMRLADAVLLVTRPGRTAKRQLERGLEAIDQGKLIGAIVNDSHDVGMNDYYHYYGNHKMTKTVQGEP